MNEMQAVEAEIELEELKRRYAALESQHRALERTSVAQLGRADMTIWRLKCRLRVIHEMCSELPDMMLTHGQKNGYVLAIGRFAEKGDNVLLRYQLDPSPGDLDDELPF